MEHRNFAETMDFDSDSSEREDLQKAKNHRKIGLELIETVNVRFRKNSLLHL